MPALFERRRRELGAWVLGPELGIGRVALMAVRIAEVESRFGRIVKLVSRHVIAHHVPAMLVEPQIAGAGIPVESDRVADASRIDLIVAAIWADSGDQGVAIRVGLTDVARRTDGHIEP